MSEEDWTQWTADEAERLDRELYEDMLFDAFEEEYEPGPDDWRVDA